MACKELQQKKDELFALAQKISDQRFWSLPTDLREGYLRYLSMYPDSNFDTWLKLREKKKPQSLKSNGENTFIMDGPAGVQVLTLKKGENLRK